MTTDFREHESRSPWNWLGIHWFKGLVSFFTSVVFDRIGSADPSLAFYLDDTAKFTVGVDDSDSDKFKISAGSALGTTDRLVIDSSGYIGVGTSTPTQSGQTTATALLNIAGIGSGNHSSLILTTDQTAINSVPGLLVFGTPNTGGSEKRSAVIYAINTAAATSNITAGLYFLTNNANTLSTRMVIKPDGTINLSQVDEHADNAAAVAAGHANGDIYRTGDALKIVHA